MSDRERQRLTACIENALEDCELAPVLMEDERDLEKVRKIEGMANALKIACLDWRAYLELQDMKQEAS